MTSPLLILITVFSTLNSYIERGSVGEPTLAPARTKKKIPRALIQNNKELGLNLLSVVWLRLLF